MQDLSSMWPQAATCFQAISVTTKALLEVTSSHWSLYNIFLQLVGVTFVSCAKMAKLKMLLGGWRGWAQETGPDPQTHPTPLPHWLRTWTKFCNLFLFVCLWYLGWVLWPKVSHWLYQLLHTHGTITFIGHHNYMDAYTETKAVSKQHWHAFVSMLLIDITALRCWWLKLNSMVLRIVIIIDGRDKFAESVFCCCFQLI